MEMNEREFKEFVINGCKIFGFGNIINELRTEWMKILQKKYNVKYEHLLMSTNMTPEKSIFESENGDLKNG